MAKPILGEIGRHTYCSVAKWFSEYRTKQIQINTEELDFQLINSDMNSANEMYFLV